MVEYSFIGILSEFDALVGRFSISLWQQARPYQNGEAEGACIITRHGWMVGHRYDNTRYELKLVLAQNIEELNCLFAPSDCTRILCYIMWVVEVHKRVYVYVPVNQSGWHPLPFSFSAGWLVVKLDCVKIKCAI